MCLGGCICVTAGAFLPGWNRHVCVCVRIYKFWASQWFIQNKHDKETERESEESVLFSFFHWDTTGFYFLFDECVTLFSIIGSGHFKRVEFESEFKGSHLVFNLYFKFKACLHGKKRKREKGRR